MRYAVATINNLPGHLIKAAELMATRANSVAPLVVWEANELGLYKLAACLPAYMPNHSLGQCNRIVQAWQEGGLMATGRVLAHVELIEEEGSAA